MSLLVSSAGQQECKEREVSPVLNCATNSELNVKGAKGVTVKGLNTY